MGVMMFAVQDSLASVVRPGKWIGSFCVNATFFGADATKFYLNIADDSPQDELAVWTTVQLVRINPLEVIEAFESET